MTKGFLGIDAGTQGLSVVFCDESLRVLATGEGSYEMLPGLSEGCYEQSPASWEAALSEAMAGLKASPADRFPMEILAIGISGQMHGEVLADENGSAIGASRLWCDGRNQTEADELTERFGVKMPKRITAARWLWTIRNHPEKAHRVRHLTTPGGWIAYKLTGQFNLGIGDAAGMFPIDQDTFDYRKDLMRSFDEAVDDARVPPLRDLLPTVRKAGEEAGVVSQTGAEWIGVDVGIPVAAAEGDQPASLAGSLIGDPGMVSVSFGTSVCANSVGDRAFQGVSPAVDHFCAPDGKPINMVWLRNGTTYMNTLVEMFATASSGGRRTGFADVMLKVLDADPDCGGILALPFMDDEPGLGVHRGGTAMLIGLNADNATPGNVVKSALLSTMFNLRWGSETLDQQGFPRHELILSGGLTKTPELAQILADVFDTRVTLLDNAEEGCAWGAALLAKYRHSVAAGNQHSWSSFLLSQSSGDRQQFVPTEKSVRYAAVYAKYKQLMELQPELDSKLAGDNAD
jgi:sugar (pentulose or hexulose) kinase